MQQHIKKIKAMKMTTRPFAMASMAMVVAIGMVGGKAMVAKAQSYPLTPRNSFYGNINVEFAINGNSHLPVRLGGGASFDLGYMFGNNRLFINSGITYLSGIAADIVFFDNYNLSAFTFLHVPLTLNYGVVLNAGRLSFIPSVGFGYSFSTTYAYDNNNGGKTGTFNTSSFIVGPKLAVVYNMGDSGFIGGTAGGYVFASQFLKLSYAVVAFTGGARF